MIPEPVPVIDVVEPEALDDTPSSFWLLAVTAGGVLTLIASIHLIGALLIGVTA